ncbi:MAG TPA: phosphoglucosamine mutase, partial [bacterium]|nr:phosphoglucosamine mutase [bacterium]
AFASGVMAAGCAVEPLGRIPTPGVAHITRTHNAVAGAMISASHNPIEDNGIKLFAGDGTKLRADQEAAIEACLADPVERRTMRGATTGTFRRETQGPELYRQYLLRVLARDLTGLKVVIDCGHGAASGYAPALFQELGAQVIAINFRPDGHRINVECGSEHPADVERMVPAVGADFGIAYDGDADRAILVDDAGALVDGDHILCMAALHRLRNGGLPANAVVGTVLTNQGLEAVLQEHGARLERVDVGDKYIAWRMQELAAVLGGEQSGHLIFGDHATTGDGILTSLKVAELVLETGLPLAQLARQMVPFPQVAINVPAQDKESWRGSPELLGYFQNLEQELFAADAGRLLVRPSGTQPLIRVMVESQTPEVALAYAQKAETALRQFLQTRA